MLRRSMFSDWLLQTPPLALASSWTGAHCSTDAVCLNAESTLLTVGLHTILLPATRTAQQLSSRGWPVSPTMVDINTGYNACTEMHNQLISAYRDCGAKCHCVRAWQGLAVRRAGRGAVRARHPGAVSNALRHHARLGRRRQLEGVPSSGQSLRLSSVYCLITAGWSLLQACCQP